MSTIGTLTETKPGEVFKGNLNTLEISLVFEIRRVKLSGNPNAPTHAIFAWGKSGAEVPVGAAWLKTIKKLGREGEEFLSLTFSDPSFGRPFNVAAFKSEMAGEWNIIFRHRPEKAA
jgi:uncharacterized protein (DUF736 family)